MQTKFRNFI